MSINANNSAKPCVTTDYVDLKNALSTSGNIIIGQQIDIIVSVINNGNANATNVINTISIPTGLTYHSDNGNGAYNNGNWDIGTLTPGQSKTLNITVDVVSSFVNAKIIAVLTLAETDTNPADNTVSITLNTTNAYHIYTDNKASGIPPDAAEIIAGIEITGQNDTDINYQPNMSGEYLWVAVPVGKYSQDFIKWESVENPLNNGLIPVSNIDGSSNTGFILKIPGTVNVNGDDYDIYMSNYVSQFTDTLRLFN